jgi:hypothetical protein
MNQNLSTTGILKPNNFSHVINPIRKKFVVTESSQAVNNILNESRTTYHGCFNNANNDNNNDNSSCTVPVNETLSTVPLITRVTPTTATLVAQTTSTTIKLNVPDQLLIDILLDPSKPTFFTFFTLLFITFYFHFYSPFSLVILIE